MTSVNSPSDVSKPDDSGPPALGPRSLLWRWAGDMRIAFEGGTAGLLQTMHPAIGQGLIDHSDFFDDPVDRVFRSLPGILGTIYNGELAEATGVQVRDFHRDIKGSLPDGDRYHALQPETFWWAHATFQRMVDRLALHWDRHRLTAEQSEQLYAEGCEWYRRYGVTGSVVPPDRAAFVREVERYCDEVLAPNPASTYLIVLCGALAFGEAVRHAGQGHPCGLAFGVGAGRRRHRGHLRQRALGNRVQREIPAGCRRTDRKRRNPDRVQ